MATKKKTKKKSLAKKNRKPARPAKKAAKKKSAPPKKVAKRTAGRATVAKSSRKQTGTKRQAPSTRISRVREEEMMEDADSQGLSRAERADSESVAELLDEGNTFEAGVVRGVEEADNADEREVRTHEVPEDDVPEEYLDEQ